MSTLSLGKTKLGKFVKGLFGKSDVETMSSSPPPSPPVIPLVPAPAPKSSSPKPFPAKGNGYGLELPLQLVLDAIPIELRAKVKQTEVGDLTISLPFEKVLSQLAVGRVKIAFGELRQAVPQVFAAENDQDHVFVTLPLSEILIRLSPALLVRRPGQKQVEISEDVGNPFGNRGQGLTVSQTDTKPMTPTQPTVPVRPTAAIPFPKIPMPSVRLSPPLAASSPSHPPFVQSPLITMRTPPASVPPPSSKVNSASTPPLPLPRPAPIPQRNVPAIPVTPASPTTVSHPVQSGSAQVNLAVPLAALADNWPDSLRQEIVQLNLMNAKVALPLDKVEPALKRGRVVFPWQTVRSWIRPALPATTAAHEGIEVELPLKVIAPLFLSHQNANAQARRKMAVDPDIPNLFFGFPKPESPARPAPAAPATKPPDTNYYVWSDTSEVARVDEAEFKRKPSPGTAFVTRCATPNEVVSRAAALDGVAGALIALPDGLMVASQIPPELNGDTLAAFLPQIFGKMSQCTKELRMGELNNLNFTVGNVPWKIFRVNAIFFATFGRAGEPLPTAQLAALAAELDRKRSN